MTAEEQLKYAYKLGRRQRPTTDDLEAVHEGTLTQDDWYDDVEPNVFSDALDVCVDVEARDISDEVRAGLSDSWRDAFTDYLNVVYGS